MILRSCLFSLQASYRLLNSTCYFAHLCSLSAENLISDLPSSAILMILRSFLFSLQASYRVLISTCYFTHLHGFGTENLIPDLLSCAISISKVSFKSVIAVDHNAQFVNFSTENIILSSKTSPRNDLRRESLIGDLSMFLR